MKLLLIDSRLKDITVITNSVNSDTKYIIIDYFNDTFENVLNKISNLGVNQFTNIAYMAHGVYTPVYKMLNKQQTYSILFGISNKPLDSWKEITDFYRQLITLYGISYVDYLGCCLIDKPEWKYLFDEFDKLLNVTFRGSSNETGNMNGGDWILETDDTDVKELYFTDGILEYEHNLFFALVGYYNRILNKPSKTIPGKVITWGDTMFGGNISNIDYGNSKALDDIISIYSNWNAFAALDVNGHVESWGDAKTGGNISNIEYGVSGGVNNVINIFSTYDNGKCSFAALTTYGNIITWGSIESGGNINHLDYGTSQIVSNIISIYSSTSAFAALNTYGNIITWGFTESGGNINHLTYGTKYNKNNIMSIYSNEFAFAALNDIGKVIAWGNPSFGGNINQSQYGASSTTNIISISSTVSAFAALQTNGNVITWGDITAGGNINDPDYGINGSINNVNTIYSNYLAFAALLNDGNVKAWGFPQVGGNINDPEYGTQIELNNIVSIYSTLYAFIALKNDGTVITWGFPMFGGNINDPIYGTFGENNNIVSIYSTPYSCAALKLDGTVITWGQPIYGGNINDPVYGTTNVSNVVSICITPGESTSSAFAALKEDGTIVTWGGNDVGGNINDPDFGTTYNGNVVSIYSSGKAFVAISSDVTNYDISSYSNYDKIEILRNPLARNRISTNVFVLPSNFVSELTGDLRLNYNIPNQQYNLINCKTKSVTEPSYLGNGFVIPTLDGERITIDGIQYANYDKRIYRVVDGVLERVTNNVTLYGNVYSLFGGYAYSNQMGIYSGLIGGYVPTLPDIPRYIYVTPDDGELIVSFSEPFFDGGSSIIRYEYSSNLSTWTSINIPDPLVFNLTGLTNGTTYTYYLRAVNGIGEGPYKQFSGTPQIGGGGAIGDPHIVTIHNELYDLPHDENCYLLFDNNNLKDRVVITCKNWFLPKELKDNSPFFVDIMDNTTFMKYINISVNNKQLTIDMETLKPVQYTTDDDVNDFKLKKIDFARNKNIQLDKICKDTDVFKKYYSSYMKRTFNIQFNGKSRNLLLKSNDLEYKVKLSVDTNCADLRNEIRIFGNFSKECTGAFISKLSAKCIPSLIYN